MIGGGRTMLPTPLVVVLALVLEQPARQPPRLCLSIETLSLEALSLEALSLEALVLAPPPLARLGDVLSALLGGETLRARLGEGEGEDWTVRARGRG